MQERIVLAPGANGNELLKSIAAFGGKTMNTRVMGGAEFARFMLMRSGIAIEKEIISHAEEAVHIAAAVSGEPYFPSPSFADIRDITNAIRTVRMIAVGDEGKTIEKNLLKGKFDRKNKALLNIYQRYAVILDKDDCVDSVSLMRLALPAGKEFLSEVFCLEEYPLSPLEKEMLEKASGGNVKKVSLKHFFDKDEHQIRISSYKACYGSTNEVEEIITDIYKNKNLDESVVAVTDTGTYSQLFFDYAISKNIPVTFGCGVPISNANPARLLSLYHRWMTKGFFGVDSLIEMVFSPAFDRNKLKNKLSEKLSEGEELHLKDLISMFGGLKLTNDAKENKGKIRNLKKALEEEEKIAREGDLKDIAEVQSRAKLVACCEMLAQELALPAGEFISRYSYIRQMPELLRSIDVSAKGAIENELDVAQKINGDGGIGNEEIIENILGGNVCRQQSRAGKLHITSISGAMSTVRKNLYIAGLSANNYPGKPMENYLLLDCDIEDFCSDKEYAENRQFTSEGRIFRKKNTLMKLVELYSALGANINISYPGLNVSELKNVNASSLVYDLFRKEHGENATAKDLENAIVKTEYFSSSLLKSGELGKAYVEGKKIICMGAGEEKTQPVSWTKSKSYSPSALGKFFECKRRFLLERLLGLPQEEENDPFTVISSADRGTLAHALMERLANNRIEKEDFLKMAEESFDNFLAQNPVLIAENAAGEKEDFLEMMTAAYEEDPQRPVVLAEEDISHMHPAGIEIHGFPDRVERLEDGTCIVVDYKSGNSIKHEENDINTCLQAVIYAYLLEEEKGLKISGAEFRYIALRETVCCRYDDEMKKLLEEKLKEVKAALDSGEFPIAADHDDKTTCRYCSLKAVCGKN